MVFTLDVPLLPQAAVETGGSLEMRETLSKQLEDVMAQ